MKTKAGKLSLEELEHIHLDALQEICNVGMGHAATALSQMISRPIHLSVPKVHLVHLSLVPEIIGGAEQVVVGIYMQIYGEVQGNILLVFPWESAQTLSDLLTGEKARHETGLTEMHAQQLTRSHGYTPSDISYRGETAVAYSLQRIVGAARLRRAYLTGDFTEVRRIVDRRLGAGTFGRLARMPNGYAALSFLRGRMDAAGVDHRAWSSPLVDVTLVAVTDTGRRANPPTAPRSRGNR